MGHLLGWPQDAVWAAVAAPPLRRHGLQGLPQLAGRKAAHVLACTAHTG